MSYPFRHVIVIGASSGIGEAMVRRLAADGCRVALLARRLDRIEAIAGELNAATGGEAGTPAAIAVAHDVHDRAQVPALFQQIAHRLGGVDAVIYAAGLLTRVEPDEYDTAKDMEMMEVNILGAIAWLNEAASRFEQVGRGTIVGIGSIAGDRGRRANPIYNTSKAALATYLEALRNRVARAGVAVVTIKPGFVDTAMTRGMSGLLWLVSADRAAEITLRAAARRSVVAYVPGRWRLVSLVLRSIPSVIFRRLNV